MESLVTRVLSLLLLLPALACAQELVSFPHDLDASRIRLELAPERSAITARVHLRGHALEQTDSLVLALHPGLEVLQVESGFGPCDHFRPGGEDLLIRFPRVLRPGEPYRLRIDYGGALRDLRLSPGPSITPVTWAGEDRPLAGIGAHLDAPSGLVLPRESFWYPRPRHRDPQELALWLVLPEDWVLTARLFPEHDTPQPGRRRLRVLRSHGQVAHPLGLAAGPYEVDTRRFGEAELRWFRYPRELAEHPPHEPAWEEVTRLMEGLEALLGPPGRGRLDLVQLMGSLPREIGSTGLSQGSFLWLAGPWPTLDDRGRQFLARELARFWVERGVQLEEGARNGVQTFLALLVMRDQHGDDVFRQLCRDAAARYGSDIHPAKHVLPRDIDAWEIRPPPPDPVDAGRNLVMALIDLYQRKGPASVTGALRRLVTEHHGGRATAQELLDLIDGA